MRARGLYPIVLFLLLLTIVTAAQTRAECGTFTTKNSILQRVYWAERIAVKDPDGKIANNTFFIDPHGFVEKYGILAIPSTDSIQKIYSSVTLQYKKSRFIGATAEAASAVAWESQLIIGLGEFLLERAKAEVTLAFADEIKKIFDTAKGSDNYSKELKKLFPNTATMVISLDALAFKSALPNIKAAVEVDFRELSLHLVEMYESSSKDADELRSARVKVLRPLAECVERFINGANPVMAIGEFTCIQEIPPTDRSADKNIKRVGQIRDMLYLLGYVAREYHFEESSQFDFDDVLDKKNRAYHFMGFLIKDLYDETEMFKDLEKTYNDNDRIIYQAAAKYIRDGERYLATLQSAFEQVKQVLDEIKDKAATEEKEGIKENRYVIYSRAFFKTLIVAKEFIPVTNTIDRQELAEAYSLIERLNGLNESIIEKNYARVISYTIMLVKNNFGIDIKEKPMRFVTLASNLAAAKTSDDMKTAIAAFADPVGSYKGKRNSGFGVSLNSYFGASFGHERLSGDFSDDKIHAINQIGPFLPVGLEFSFGKKWNFYKGLIITVIDLGNYASFRINDVDTVDNNPEIGFGQVFAPGAYLVFGFLNNPITIGAGVQYAADIRKLEDDEAEKLSALRIGAFIAIDLTLFRF